VVPKLTRTVDLCRAVGADNMTLELHLGSSQFHLSIQVLALLKDSETSVSTTVLESVFANR
jgi:hypothetical protein